MCPARLNSTSETSGVTDVSPSPISSVPILYSSISDGNSRVRDESTTSLRPTYQPGSNSKVHIESSVTDFEDAKPTVTEPRVTTASTENIDIGTIIPGLITKTHALPTVHTEEPVSDWEPAPPTGYPPNSGIYSISEIGHAEISTSGWENQYHPSPPLTQTTRYEPGNPRTDDPEPTQPPLPDKPREGQSQITAKPSKVITEYPPPPAMTHSGVTFEPIVVTHRPTVTLPGGALTTTDSVEYEVKVGSSTLRIGTPVTVNDVVVSLTTDAAGSTVLLAGDMTTTLPRPTAGEVHTVTEDTPGRLNIVTAIVGGTTKYIFAGQTLAPGQPVTIGDTPISVATHDGQTVLYVGDKSTTLAPANSNVKTLTQFYSDDTGAGGTTTGTRAVAATPTRKASISSLSKETNVTLAYFTMGVITIIAITWF